MSTSPRLSLAQVPSNSLQPSVPVNDHVQALDALVQGSVVQALRNTPPTTLASDAGICYVVGDNPTGLWAGKGFNIAICTGADTWRFLPPKVGMAFYVQDQGIVLVNHSTGWAPETRITTKTASGGLALADARWIDVDVAGANTLEVPPSGVVAFPVGRTFLIRQKGAGQVTLTPGTGVTLRTASTLKTRAQQAVVRLTKIGAEEWSATGDLEGAVGFTGGSLTSALNEAKGADIASAATTDIGAATGNFVHVTGTVTITGLGTVQAGTRRIVRFAGALTLTHNATSLILPGGVNITTAANDVATFVSEGGGNWRLAGYLRADGSGALADGSVTTAKLANGAVTPAKTSLPVTALSIATGAVNIDLSLGRHFTLTLSANVTSITFTNLPAAGFAGEIAVRIVQDATGSRTVALPAAFKATGGSDTAVASAANAVTLLTAVTFDQGTSWAYAMQDVAA